MGRRDGWIALAGLVLTAMSAWAQAQTHATLELGGRVTGAASGPGGDLYAVMGLEGTRLQVVLALPGRGAVTLYDPDGAELARVEGEGGAELSHTLAADGIHLLGVTRAQAGGDYSLALDGQVPRVEYVYDEPESDQHQPDGHQPAPVPTMAAMPEAPAAAPPSASPAAAPVVPATVAPAPAAPAVVADPATWGVYAQLGGRRSVAVPGSYTLAWTWVRPGEELVEQWLDAAGRVVHAATLTPTGQPGQLAKRGTFVGGKDLVGTVEADGSVTLVGRGLLSWPHQVGIANGVFEMRRVKRPGTPEMTVEPAGERTRWVLQP